MFVLLDMFDGSLAMSCTLNHYPSRILLGNVVTRHKILCKTRFNPVLAVPPSSTFLQTDESGNLPESKKSSSLTTSSISNGIPNSLLSQANTVGVIGGVSVDSTLNFLKKIVDLSLKDGGEGCVPFVLCSDPMLSKELLLYERASFRSHSRRNESSRLDHAQIVDNLCGKRVFLENSGARCVVTPCHIAHSWHDKISEGSSVPVLHMGECVARELKEARLKPLEAGSPLRIGVLGTNATLDAGFYQEKLQNEGFEVVVPDKAAMEHTVIPAVEALNRNDMEGARNLMRIALQVLLVRAVNTVILASDDMRNILPRDDPLLRKCIDPMDALARSTVKWAQSAKNGK